MKINDLLAVLDIPRSDQVYYPSDDSFLMIDYFETREFKEFLEKYLETLIESKRKISARND